MSTGATAAHSLAPAQSGPVGFHYCTPEDYASHAWCPSGHPLAAIVHGDFDPPARPWPQISSHLQPLGGGPRVEILSTTAPASYERTRGMEIAWTDDLLFICARADERETAGVAVQAERLYDLLLQVLLRRGYPYLLRTWNILQDINREEGGLERYRQFCLGRHEALARGQGDLQERYPAASGVGSSSGGLCVYALAAKTPGIPVENPNQVSAYHYPVRYGPRSPSFSRGLVKIWDRGSNFFMSGTASITGHESRHLGQLDQQVDNTLNNLDSLVAAAERKAKRRFPIVPGGSVLKAYVRDPADCSRVRARIDERFGAGIEIVYLRADICRAELLCEIDGVVFASETRPRASV